MIKVKRAIVSVTDKTGVAEFAASLSAMGVEIISTGGTAKALRDAGVDVVAISDVTGLAEMLDGRVKTLHPKIHGGILAVRDKEGHKKDMEAAGIEPIDMVVVNLYAFEKTIEGGASLGEAIENIDIGGPCMVRAAAKNHKYVSVVTDPADYDAILKEMGDSDGSVSLSTRLGLAKKAFSLTARYDGAISNYLTALSDDEGSEKDAFPGSFTVQYEKIQGLRYGENPHQEAAFYTRRGAGGDSLAGAKKLHGKELSYNNILDLNACLGLVREFTDPAAVLVKHNNPCGVAHSPTSLEEAYEKALSTDSKSAFGGIFGFNRVVTAELATSLKDIFFEAIIAPGYEDEAAAILQKKKNLRIMEIEGLGSDLAQGLCAPLEQRTVDGGLLLQGLDTGTILDLKTVTDRGPTEAELSDLLFAWKVCKHVKSNAIILASGGQTIGIGAGQMSRIDSTRLSVIKAEDASLEVRGTVLASDAFFPFRDNVDMAAGQGVKAIIQPGGSIRDEEVIEAANEQDIAMVFTGIRHFRH